MAEGGANVAEGGAKVTGGHFHINQCRRCVTNY